ncbi:MAG: PqqD family protein [Chloroflexi bacterium]|nr:PqqD family protein [Chloroflexota bacterium]
MKKPGDNFLLLCPSRNNEIAWEEQQKKINLKKQNKSLLDKFLQNFFRAPKTTRITLDEYGSAVWKMCDGRTKIMDIGRSLEEEFGDEIKPTYPRLVEFIKLLLNQELIKIHDAVKEEN